MIRRSAIAIAIAIGVAVPSRGSAAPTSARGYDSAAATPWPTTAPGELPEPAAPPAEDDVGTADGPSVPPPRPVAAPAAGDRLAVAVGLAPEAPGSQLERDLLDRLEASARVSPDPPTTVRRLRPGGGDGHTVCRDRKDDLVVLVGYVPERPEPVLLAHDCRLDLPLGLRAVAAAGEPGLVGALWAEHAELVRKGARERRLGRLPVKARIGIAAGVAIVVIGVAVGLLVANALRKDVVVLKVSP
ncbi:MAG: hypothetical protein K1X88_00500 [Nannocystaceae bacterium]|nr:hypothetical protein [Nannocystaceae bacterium]